MRAVSISVFFSLRDFPQIRTLGKVRTTGIERGTLSAFEDFLCALIRGSTDVNEVLKDNGVIIVCQVTIFWDKFCPLHTTSY